MGPARRSPSQAVRENQFVVEAAGPAGRRSRVLPLSPQWGWSLLLPFDYAFGPEVGWLSALWIGCWLLPVDFWLGGGDVNPILAAALTIVLLALGLVAIPALLQEPGSLPKWGAGLASAVSGWGLARRARASARPPAPQARAL